MRFLVAEKLGPHKFKTPEGYLICTDAILSRTGKQEYKRCEIFGDACDEPDKIVNVDRVDAEVFSDKAMASFENKPICIEHPDHDVNAENHNELAVGFVRDVHKGEDEGKPVMMGTLVITDKDAVEAVESGEYKELSCGYDCDIDDNDEPCQRNIRGNHVALCKHGRAGIARIVDSVDDARFWGQQYPYELWLTYPKTGRKFMAGAFKTHEEARRNTDRLRKEFTRNVDGIPNAEIRENFRDSVDDAGIKVWQVRQGYAIVVKRYWQQYGKNAFVDATESSIEAARYHRGSLERNDKMDFVIIDCNDGKYKIEDSEMKDIQSTKAPGTDKIIYVMQSDIDKNLYFYIGKTFSMKEGAWGYTKFEMGNTTPEQLKAELSKNGWHAVSQGVARIIDAEHEVVTDEIMKDESRQTLIEKLRTVSVPYGERYALTSGSGWHIDIQHHGQETYESINRYPHVSPKESSKATIRLWYNGKHMKTFEGSLNSAKSDAIRYLQTRTEDSWSSVEEENYNKANKAVIDEEYVQLPRGRFKVVAKTKEELEKEGYGYHHSANGYSVYVKNNHAVAVKDATCANDSIVNDATQKGIEIRLFGSDYQIAYVDANGRQVHQRNYVDENTVKQEIAAAKRRGERVIYFVNADVRRRLGDASKDLTNREQLFTIEYKQGDTTYIRKVRASSIEDAISKVKDVYNKFEHETDKEYLKSSIDEMSRYIRNWSYMSTREKRDISPEGLGALKQMLKFAQQRLAELK